eukprot:526334_1
MMHGALLAHLIVVSSLHDCLPKQSIVSPVHVMDNKYTTYIADISTTSHRHKFPSVTMAQHHLQQLIAIKFQGKSDFFEFYDRLARIVQRSSMPRAIIVEYIMN